MNETTRQLSRPDIIITHESDLDGLISGVLLRRLAKHLFDVQAPMQAYHNHNWRQRPLVERSGWVSDLAFETRLDKPGWMIVDHHACLAQPKQATLVHDAGKSAGLLAYELCVAHGLPGTPALQRLVHLNNVADLFLVEDSDFDIANDYANLVKSYSFWNLHDLVEGEVERLLDHPLLEVMAVKRRVEDPIGLSWSRDRIVPISPKVGYVDTVVGNVNLIVHQLLRDPGNAYPVLVTLFRKGNGTIIASLRSRNGEAIVTAGRLQGGGHPNAAGATLPRSVQQIPDAIEYMRKLLNVQVDKAPGNLEQLLESW